MAKPIMIQGTMSNAGKSLLAAALCRIFRQDGYRVAPFKSQNMALNSYITDEGLEMGRAQVVQAEAAGIKPSVLMNPILLKPTTDVGSQVIVNGEVRGNMGAMEYYRRKTEFLPDIMNAYRTLDEAYDIIVLEGAGSAAEINLKDNDIVNMGMAKLAKAPVLLVGDIDRGGVFAQLFGTVKLLDETERGFVKALVVNKFRGDVEILKPGLVTLEELTGVPVAGVVPYTRVDVDDEDSLSERFSGKRGGTIDVAVVRLPKISNFTDFAVFERFEEVSVRYVSSLWEFGAPDLILIPGTKNTIADLKWLRESGLEGAILRAAHAGTIVFGVCGGFQMLGSMLRDPLGVEGGGEIRGLGLLDVETTFGGDKVRTQISGTLDGISGALRLLNGLPFRGYEIHMGRSESGQDRQTEDSERPEPQKAHRNSITIVSSGTNVYGSYVHGIFDEGRIAETILRAAADRKGIPFDEARSFDPAAQKEQEYDKLADAVRSALDMDLIYRILEEGI